jgi:hypothetical protein
LIAARDAGVEIYARQCQILTDAIRLGASIEA